MAIAFSSKVSISKDVMIRQVGDESVLLDLNSAKYLGLDDVSTRIWGVLTSGTSIQSAHDTLVAEFDVDPEQLRKDLGDFILELLDLGLVRVEQP